MEALTRARKCATLPSEGVSDLQVSPKLRKRSVRCCLPRARPRTHIVIKESLRSKHGWLRSPSAAAELLGSCHASALRPSPRPPSRQPFPGASRAFHPSHLPARCSHACLPECLTTRFSSCMYGCLSLCLPACKLVRVPLLVLSACMFNVIRA